MTNTTPDSVAFKTGSNNPNVHTPHNPHTIDIWPADIASTDNLILIPSSNRASSNLSHLSTFSNNPNAHAED